MGTTATSGWATLWFMLGFTILGTAMVGGGIFSAIAGLALIGLSLFLYKAARVKEEA